MEVLGRRSARRTSSPVRGDQERPKQDLVGTARTDCRETARGGARGINGAAILWQSHGVFGNLRKVTD